MKVAVMSLEELTDEQLEILLQKNPNSLLVAPINEELAKREEGYRQYWAEVARGEKVNGCGKTYTDGRELKDGDLCPHCAGTGFYHSARD
jgi:hypothetical protein